MALTMDLELEGDSPDWSACAEAARLVGVLELTMTNERLTDGEFSRSHTYFRRAKSGFGDEGELLPIRAEGYHGCDFLTRYRIVFRINNSLYDESVEDIKDFLTHLARLSPMKFVLSFQLEGVYAVRCSGGLEWFWHEPHDAKWQPPIVPEPETSALKSLLSKVGLRKK